MQLKPSENKLPLEELILGNTQWTTFKGQLGIWNQKFSSKMKF